MKKGTLSLVVTAAVLMTFAQNIDRRRSNRESMRDNRMQRTEMVAERLSLSEEQQEQMKSLKMENKKVTKGIAAEKKVKMAELDKEMILDKPDEKKIEALVADINAINGQLFAARIRHRTDMRSLLNEEQKLKFDSFHQRYP